MKQVTIYSDGSSLGNPGRGGYGAILLYKEHVKELSQGFELTTNNRMEIWGVIAGLEALKTPCEVTVITDSQYVCNGINQWIFTWRKKNFSTILNPDLWIRLNEQLLRHKVTAQWVKGHNGHPENERCDKLARTAAEQDALQVDKGYLLYQKNVKSK